MFIENVLIIATMVKKIIQFWPQCLQAVSWSWLTGMDVRNCFYFLKCVLTWALLFCLVKHSNWYLVYLHNISLGSPIQISSISWDLGVNTCRKTSNQYFIFSVLSLHYGLYSFTDCVICILHLDGFINFAISNLLSGCVSVLPL